MAKGQMVICANCGKEHFKSNDKLKKNTTGRFFCCPECKQEYNRKRRKKSHCDYCGKEIEILPCHQKKKWHFCNQECHNNFERLGPHTTGSFYACEQCGKEVWKTPAEVERVNHVFCSSKCAGEFRQNRVTSVCPYCGKEFEHVESAYRVFCSRQCQDSATSSGLQIIVDNWLEEMNIEFEREAQLMGVNVDDYLVDYDLVIEVNGDYWHCHPSQYDSIQYEKQLNAIERDHYRENVIRAGGFPVLYLWESDIHGEAEKCKALIRSFIRKCGKLSDFHSFNYRYIDSRLFVREDRIIPYAEYKFSDLPISELLRATYRRLYPKNP